MRADARASRSTSRSSTTSRARRRGSTPIRIARTSRRWKRTSALPRQSADVVIVSHHWGIHFVRAVIADYQRDVARAAIAAGADAIIGGHAHILKGCRADRRQAGLLLAVQLRDRPADGPGARRVEKLQRDPGPRRGVGAGFRQPVQLPQGRAAVDGGAAGDRRGAGRPRRASCRSTSAATRFRGSLAPGSAEHAEVVDYLTAVTAEAGLNARFRVAADMVEAGDARMSRWQRFPLEGFVALYFLMYLPNVIITRLVTSTAAPGSRPAADGAGDAAGLADHQPGAHLPAHLAFRAGTATPTRSSWPAGASRCRPGTP